jgi:hypothetical protein
MDDVLLEPMNPDTRPGEVVLTGEARWLLATLLHSCDSDTAELFDFSGGCAGTVISSATCGAWGAALWDQLPNLCLIRFSSPSSPGGRAHMLIAAPEAQRVGERLGSDYRDWLANIANFFVECDGLTLADVDIVRPDYCAWREELQALATVPTSQFRAGRSRLGGGVKLRVVPDAPAL